MLSLRNLAQSKEQLPISKVGPFKRGKFFFFFYWYAKLVGSKRESFISAVSLSATDSYNHMQTAIPFERLFKWTNTKEKEKQQCFHSEWLPQISVIKSQGYRSSWLWALWSNTPKSSETLSHSSDKVSASMSLAQWPTEIKWLKSSTKSLMFPYCFGWANIIL